MSPRSKREKTPVSFRRRHALSAILALAGLYMAVSPSPVGGLLFRFAGLVLAAVGYALWRSSKERSVAVVTAAEPEIEPLPSSRIVPQPASGSGAFLPPIRQPRSLHIHSFAFQESEHLPR